MLPMIMKVAVPRPQHSDKFGHLPSSQMVFSFGDLIEYCSAFLDLEPGDVIVTGTPGGVGAARTPPLWMKPGDRIEVDVKPVGTLVNDVAGD